MISRASGPYRRPSRRTRPKSSSSASWSSVMPAASSSSRRVSPGRGASWAAWPPARTGPAGRPVLAGNCGGGTRAWRAPVLAGTCAGGARRGRGGRHRRGGQRLGRAGQPLLDHPQRQVLVALHGEDVAEPLDVVDAELAVAGWRPGGRDQPGRFQEPDLRDADVRELAAELGEYLADAEVGPGRLSAHPPTCAPPPPYSAAECGPSRNISRNLPTWTSSPPVSSASSIRSRFT